MTQLAPRINLAEEVAHWVDFLGQTWTPIENLEELITAIRDAALHAGRGWFNPREVGDFASQLASSRHKRLEAKLSLPFEAYSDVFDTYCVLLADLELDLTLLHEAGIELDGAWDFGVRVSALTSSCIQAYPDLGGARLLDELKPDIQGFAGTAVKRHLSSGFASRVGATPAGGAGGAPCALVRAMYAHFLGVVEQLNTEALKRDLVAALPEAQSSTMAFERNSETENPILQVAFELSIPGPAEAEFKQFMGNRVLFHTLSAEEQATRKAARRQAVAPMLSAMRQDVQATWRQARADKLAHCTARLRAAFQGPLVG